MSNNHSSALLIDVPQQLRTAFRPLLTGIQYAEQSKCDRWDFAVEIDQLTSRGLVPNDFRWLVRNGLVEHRREVTMESDNGRLFQATGDLTFPDRTCFVLSDEGIRLARRVLGTNRPCSKFHETDDALAEPPEDQRIGLTHDGADGGQDHLPHWDSQRRVLGVNGSVVKLFKWVAVNQQTVLCAFEEEGWPPRIDDPLPPHPDQDAKRRLSDTIKCLNRKQCHPLIHFRGDGTGEGVVWEYVEQSGSSPH